MKAHQEANFGTIGRIAEQKLTSDNDIKIIIQGANSQTGVGKTTLAIELCRWIDHGEWNADEKAFIDPQTYLNSYLEYPEGSALLLDEIGAGADSRRATSTDNVELSQGWQMLRSRNIATVATLPSTNMLDNRMLELADYWILVKKRGIAQPYEIRVNDFNGKIARKPLPGDEHISFPDLPDSDPDKRYLDSIKDNKVKTGGVKSIPYPEHVEKVENAEKDARQEKRNEIIRDLYQNTELSYAGIGDLPSIDLTKQTVGQIVRKD
ncbi:hypothetical protein [Halorubrum spindle-shaped virus-BLv25]|nr:hypothetical protein [Halorubrum spindle-shaped virus-BLv25]